MADLNPGYTDKLLATGGLGAIAAAIAMMVVPAEAVAQGLERSGHQRAQSHATSNRGNGVHNRRSASRDSATRQRSYSRRSDSSRSSQRTRSSSRSANSTRNVRAQYRDRNASRVQQRANRAARQAQRQGNWRNNRVERRSTARWNNQRDYARDRRTNARRSGDTRNRNWQHSRTYRDRHLIDNRHRQANRHTSNRDVRRWNRNWRSNSRYDWHRYRARNRNVYRLGRYHSPYRNYSYRRLGIGFSLGSVFYSSRYWISDPWQYRLPRVSGPYRWVRYYDDVLLVDTYTGQVVDVIYDFFW